MEKPWLNEYDSGVPATIDYPKTPLHQFLVDAAAKFPDKTAMIYGNVVEPLGNALMDTSMTYGRLLELTLQFAAALQKLGVKKGDRVLFSKYAGTEIKIDGLEHIFMREEDILGVLG